MERNSEKHEKYQLEKLGHALVRHKKQMGFLKENPNLALTQVVSLSIVPPLYLFLEHVSSTKELRLIKVHLGSARANSLQPCRIAPLLMTGIAAFVLGALGHGSLPAMQPSSPMAPVLVAAAAPIVQEISDSVPVQAAETMVADVREEVREAATVVSTTPQIITREVELARGDSFAAMLADADVSPDTVDAVIAAFNKVYDHRKLKAGQEATLTFSRLGEEETLTGVTFQPEITREITITRAADGQFAGRVNVTPIERRRFAVKASIHSSLYEAGDREGVPRSVMAALLRAYSHTIDFQRDIHPGDQFEVLYDQPTAKDGTPAGQGVIIYAALVVGGKTKPLYRVTFADGTVDYFDEKGHSIKQALLRTPVDSARVTSGFGMRRHPLLGYSKMHQGVDFGAATGTPIFAAGSGIVEDLGFKGSYGRFILLRHNGKLETAYAHMSRYARGIYPGAKVNQGDVIGFVGTSGRSTGPHLHFEVRMSGRQVNPLSVNMPAGRVLEGKLLAQFKDGQSRIKKEFAGLVEKEEDSKLAHTEKPGFIKASASGSAFSNNKPTSSCGLRGGC